MKEYFVDIMKTLARSVDSLDEGKFAQLVDESTAALDSGHKIVVSGLGKNVPVCEKFTGILVWSTRAMWLSS